ncbi:MAG: TauD/TfdA family dioxygenase [Planctomycetes bacterium]|nr:TauD/TfdA family dioxygenase [Planctomycetota bacterium]
MSAVAPALRGDLRWSAADLRRDERYRRTLPAAVLAELHARLREHPDATAATFVWRPAAMPATAAFGADLRNELLNGDGLCLLHGLDALPDEEQRRIAYVALGCALGEPMLQYGRLYPVVDRGASYTTQAVPVSMTNAETCFHTDSSAVGVVPDFVGLLCEEPSAQGGDSLVANALRALDALRAEHPAAVALLEQPWVRDVVTPGVEKTTANLLQNRFPVFAPCDEPGGVLFRYMRYWIEVGQQKAGAPLSDARRLALDLLDEALTRDDHVLRFRLERGDVLWVNNRILAHNRTAYRDTPDNVRRLQRMWVQAPRT